MILFLEQVGLITMLKEINAIESVNKIVQSASMETLIEMKNNIQTYLSERCWKHESHGCIETEILLLRRALNLLITIDCFLGIVGPEQSEEYNIKLVEKYCLPLRI